MTLSPEMLDRKRRPGRRVVSLRRSEPAATEREVIRPPGMVMNRGTQRLIFNTMSAR